MICRHHRRNERPNVIDLSPACHVKLLELLNERFVIHLDGFGDVDELVGGLLEALLIHELLLVELLAWTQARVLNLDVHIGLVAGELDELACHVVDLHGFAHVEHEDLAALCVARCLQHQAHSFGDGHEEARDARVGHGYGSACGNLAAEQRHHRTVAAQYVAEAHSHVLGIARRISFGPALHHLDDHLAQTLGRPHHIGGIHGFIGGDEYEALGAELHGRLGDLERAHHVVLHGFVGAVLHQGHVLVRRRMEHDLGAVRVEDAAHAPGVAHAADKHLQVELGILPLELLLDLVGVVLVDVEDDELLGPEAGDLAAELRADGSAAARYEHDLAAYEGVDIVVVHDHGVAAQQVLELDFAQARDRDRLIDELVDAGDDLHLNARGLADLEDLFAVHTACGGDGEDDLVDVVLLACLDDLVAAAHDGHARDGAPPLAGVVVDDAAQFEIDEAVAAHLADETATGVARTDDHHVLGMLGVTLGFQPPEETPTEAQRESKEKRDERADEPERCRHGHMHDRRDQVDGDADDQPCGH